MKDKKQNEYPLRTFYIKWSLIIGIIANIIYIFSGYEEGLGLANLLEFVIGFVYAIPITLIYFILNYKDKK